MPVYVLLVTGLKSFTEVTLDRMWALPESFSLDSFRDAWFGNAQTAIPGIAKNFSNTHPADDPGHAASRRCSGR